MIPPPAPPEPAGSPPPPEGPGDLAWLDGARPFSTRFGDAYFSAAGGLEESRYVFLDGNGLPGRFRPGFHIAELGFGTGLNLLAALLLWRSSGTPGPLRFTSFEAYPLPAAQIARALAAFPELAAVAPPFLEAYAASPGQIVLDGLRAEVIVGDATETLPAWAGAADAWCLDGFAPAKNPGLWTAELLAQVALHSAPGATFATYTAAGHVRRALQAAGFAVHRRPGFGHKRHMALGQLPPHPAP